jgi:hypothetical protein
VWGGGSNAVSTWRREGVCVGGGGLDKRCAEGGRQLCMSGGGGNGREVHGQGREAAHVRAYSNSTGWRQNLIQNQSSNGFKFVQTLTA